MTGLSLSLNPLFLKMIFLLHIDDYDLIFDKTKQSVYAKSCAEGVVQSWEFNEDDSLYLVTNRGTWQVNPDKAITKLELASQSGARRDRRRGEDYL